MDENNQQPRVRLDFTPALNLSNGFTLSGCLTSDADGKYVLVDQHNFRKVNDDEGDQP